MFSVTKPHIPPHAVVLISNRPAFAANVARHLVRHEAKRPIAFVGDASTQSQYAQIARELTKGETRGAFFSNPLDTPAKARNLLREVEKQLGPALAIFELKEVVLDIAAICRLRKGTFNIHLEANQMLGAAHYEAAQRAKYGRMVHFQWIDTAPGSDYVMNGGDFTHEFRIASFFPRGSEGEARDIACLKENVAFQGGADFMRLGTVGDVAQWTMTAGPSYLSATMAHLTMNVYNAMPIESRFGQPPQ